MSRFDRYMLSQLMTIFGFASVVLVLIYWINRAVRLFDWLIASGQTATVFLEFTALSLPNVIRLVLPVSAFAAAVYVTNRLTSESELVVVQATGYGPFRLARPVLVFGLAVAAFVAVLVHLAVPASFARLADRQIEVTENVTARLLVEGRFVHPATGVTLYIRQITPAGELTDIYLRDARRDSRHVTYTASRALLTRSDTGPRLLMYDGMAQTLDTRTRGLSVTRFDSLGYDIGALLASGTRPGEGPQSLRELSTAALFAAEPGIAERLGTTPAAMRLEGHQRFTQAMMALAAPLIGFATLMLGGFSRFGVWNQVLGAIGLIVLLQLADNAIVDLTLSAPALWPLVYLPSAGGLALAAGLLWLAGHPIRRRRPAPGGAAP